MLAILTHIYTQTELHDKVMTIGKVADLPKMQAECLQSKTGEFGVLARKTTPKYLTTPFHRPSLPLEWAKVKFEYVKRKLTTNFLFDDNSIVALTVAIFYIFAVEMCITLSLTFSIGKDQMKICQ